MGALVFPDAIPTGIIIMWDGTHSSIPSGWVRETTLDDTFIKGTANGVNPNVTGGAATHTHTTDANHTHVYTTHVHTGSTGGPTNGIARYPETNYVNAHGPSSSDGHGYTLGTIGGTSGTGAPSWDTVNSEPSHVEPIFIKSDGTPGGFPQDSQVFQNASTLYTGWIQHVASRGIFLKGAPTSSGDGGGTGGGTHAHTGTSHTHTYPNHQHGSATSGSVGSNVPPPASRQGSVRETKPHTHTVSANSSGGGTSGGQGDTMNSEANEPAYFGLWCLDNTSAGTSYLDSVIVMWLGTLSNIPTGYLLCDGTEGTPDLREKFIKIATNSGDIGGSAGAVGHTHSGGGHTHTSTSHTHTPYVNPAGASPGTYTAWRVGTHRPASDHPHPNPTISSIAPSLESTAMTINSNADTQPPFRTVAYLFTPEASTAWRFTDATW